ncbi:MAG: VWA domain-containing protein [Magnetococcales bacterium]|nr:VWA domain-containing protein [Magnetococcales bacterium]
MVDESAGFLFLWPWLGLLWPLPWLVRRFLPPLPPRTEGALRVPFFDTLTSHSPSATLHKGERHSSTLLLAWIVWSLLVIAAARPQWLTPPEGNPVSGRDLMLAVDLSKSMSISDFKRDGQWINRLEAVKQVAGEFIARRQGDRVGLILFGTRPYLQAPLTYDQNTVRTLLDESEIGLAGDKTAIGDAIGLALKRMRDRPGGSRVMILLTDGTNTAGTLEPTESAHAAAEEGIRIYTIGIGADKPVPVPTLFGVRMVDTSRELDEKSLQALAEIGNGRYFRGSDTERLQEIYTLLDTLEPTIGKQRVLHRRAELYPWPLGMALLLLAAGIALHAMRTHLPPLPRRGKEGEVS